MITRARIVSKIGRLLVFGWRRVGAVFLTTDLRLDDVRDFALTIRLAIVVFLRFVNQRLIW